MQSPRIRIVRRDPGELSDSQIETLIQFGSQRAKLIDELEQAARMGDRARAWELTEELIKIEDARTACTSPGAA